MCGMCYLPPLSIPHPLHHPLWEILGILIRYSKCLQEWSMWNYHRSSETGPREDTSRPSSQPAFFSLLPSQLSNGFHLPGLKTNPFWNQKAIVFPVIWSTRSCCFLLIWVKGQCQWQGVWESHFKLKTLLPWTESQFCLQGRSEEGFELATVSAVI